jgi:hypothetical protein
MSEKAKAPFETVRAGCVRLRPSTEVLLARWARGCDESPHTSATHVLNASGFSFVSVVGENTGTYAQNFACPHCESEQAAERGAPPTPSCFLTGGQYRPRGQSNPRSLQCRACGRVTKPSALVEHLYPSKPKRLAFLQKHCGGARPIEGRWVAARHDGKVAVAADAEAAMDEVAPDTFPSEMELCLLLAIEQPNVAELELPFVKVALSERGEVKALGWHGERPTPAEQARHASWQRRAREQRQREIERRTRLVRAEIERETPL